LTTEEPAPTADSRFVIGKNRLMQLALGETPDTAHVVGTNRVDLAAAHDPRTGNFVITAAEDNLMKGASGQAVQIMNLWCGFPETAGLA
jgi:N-acetyl-gamma-glutamyl-phosphate reductase